MNQFLELEAVDAALCALYASAETDRERELIRAVGKMFAVLALATDRTATPEEWNKERERRGHIGMTFGGHVTTNGHKGVIPAAQR